uniref:Putative bromodomain-containing protein 8 n=1 Tax=Culex tarsalis TaxID=7177 RepID=A0A1Q3F833_CULTA
MSNLPSIQERLQLKRVPLDKWTVKEKLCLASAVACSGDQNWMSVSRALKMLCGANRPGDWFSQKSCAAQYGKLLENVETPKRKKRTNSERDGVASVETPGENILRKLTQERIIELKKIIQEEAQQYTKVKEDIILIQSGVTDEDKLREMWKQIELEKAQKEKEQILHAQWLKEREEKKLEMERQWRPAYPGSPTSAKSSGVQVKEETDEDGSSKSGKSPLLTSLLKSPTSNQAGTPGMQAVAGRSPTITNLLTGNSSGNIQGKNLFPVAAGSTSSQLQDDIKPIEATSSYQIAPNLTKLLDTTKQKVGDDQESAPVDKVEDMEIDTDSVDPAKDLMAVFQELMPEELVEILNENNGMILEDEILENVVDSIMEEEAESLKGKDLTALQDSSVTSPEDAEQNADETVPKNEEPTPEVAKGAYLKPAAAAPSPPTPPAPATANAVEETTVVVKQERTEEGAAAAEESEKAGDTQEGEPKQPTTTDQVRNEEAHDTKPSDVIPVEDSTTNSSITNPSSVDNKEDNNEDQPEHGVMVVSDSAKEEDSPSEVKTDMEEDSDDRPLASLETGNTEPMDEVKEEDSETCSSDDKSLASMPEPKPVEETKPSTTSEEEAARAKKEALEKLAAEYDFKDDEEPIVPLSIQKSKEEKHVPEEEVFMDALDNLEEPDEPTKETEPKKPDEPHVTVTEDTDDDSLIEMKISKTKRDYSRRRPAEEPPSTPKNEDPSEPGRTLRKLRDRDRSESPFVFLDDDVSEKMKRSYSSTPVIDSVPNSPASSEDRDYRAWKKSILAIHSKICSLRYASAFLKPLLPEDQSTELIFRPMDLSTVKKNIENGTIRTTAEYQRDVMLICTNATMLNRADVCSPTAARVLLKESVALIETAMDGSKSGAGAREKEPEVRSGASSANKRSSRKGTTRSSTTGSRI